LAVRLENHVLLPLTKCICPLSNPLFVAFQACEPHLHFALPLRFMTAL